MDKKNALRAGALAAGTTLMMLLMSSPRSRWSATTATTRPGLSVIDTLGLFVAAPIVLFVVIAGLVIVGEKSHKQPKQG